MRKSKILKQLAKGVNTFYKIGNTDKEAWQLEAVITDVKLIKALRILIVEAQSK